MAFTAFIGFLFQEFQLATIFIGSTLGVGLLGAIFVVSTRLLPARESFTEALTFLILFWLFLPIVIAFPFLASGQVSTFHIAYFEAVSSLTTTGASTLDADRLPKTLHVWRSSVQWLGGVVVATFAVVILAALNLKGTGVHRSLLFTFKKGELFQRLAAVARVIAGIYFTISAICFVIMVISGTPVFEALCLAMSSVSTGGFMPRSGPMEFYVGGIGLFALCLSCILGALNIASIWDVFRNRSLADIFRLIANVEHRALLIIVAFLIVVGSFYTDFHHIFTILPEAIFFATSAGFDQHVIGLEMVPPVILISVALIGGSALSTTGGLKLIRMLLLFKHLDTDMDRLTHPSRVVPVTFKAQKLPDSAFLSIWMYFFGYTLAFAAGILALAAADMDFEMAVATSASSVANMGPLLDATLPEYSYDSFTPLQLSIFTILMLIGRIEVLAAFAIISPRMWRS